MAETTTETKIPNLTKDEEMKLLSTTTEREWDATCDKIKAARGGRYPDDWWARVQLSGLMSLVQKTWRK